MATSTVVAALSLHCMATISLFIFTGDQLVWPPCWPNGVNYPVRKGCSKFDFTVEQIEQEKEKRTRMVSLSVFVLVYVWGGGDVCVGV